MQIAQTYTPGIAQCSYVIGSGSKCVVVDPVRNIDAYMEQAKSFKMDITAVLETHLHADFISGHMELAEKTGAQIYAPKTANCEFSHRALAHGEEFTIENLHFKLLETPGHTPDGAVYLVTDLSRGEEPVLAFTGDTLLVGDVGRPDLFPNQEEELAEKLFYSVKLLKELPDYVEIYPAHGMGSLCGRSLSSKLWSTIGAERRFNYALQYNDLESFKKDLLTDMPSAPDHFARCSEINRKGPVLIDKLEEPQPYSAHETDRAVKEGKTILDARPYLSFAAAHIRGAYSISKHGNFATFAGWIIPPDDELLLVLEHESDFEKLKSWLHIVGHDSIAGYLSGNIEGWINSGLPVDNIGTISVDRLYEWMRKDSPLVLDNRAKGEWEKEHVKGTTLAPTPDIRYLHANWDTDEPVVVMCNTSNRSMTAASILKQKGFKRVINVVGGTTAWAAAGYPMGSDGD